MSMVINPHRFGGAYNPATDADVLFWYKADGTLYDADTGTNPVSDGGTIGKWVESKTGGVNRDVIQATAGNRPFYRATGGPNSKPCVDFVDATIRRLSCSWSAALTQPTTTFMVCKLSSVFSLGYVFDSDNAGLNRHVIYNSTGAQTWRMFAGGESNAMSSTTNWCLLEGVFNGASSTLSLNAGSPVAQAATGAGAWQGITIGSRYATSGSNIKISEILVQNKVSTNEADIKAYLNAKYALY